MENYPSYSYPDSGDSSPRSREIDFENPPPSWEDHQQPPSKVKFMVSYAGKIQPRTHDNTLSYVGGETKILSVDRNIKFPSLYSKLSSILGSDANNNEIGSGFTMKYQLPGEDLDALISVTNDDDLENMMHEYDRIYRGSSKPARLRVFLFPVMKSPSFGSTSSDKIDRESDRFVEGLNSGPQAPLQVAGNNVDFLFGLEKAPVPVQLPATIQVPGPVQVPVPVQRHEPDPQIDARIQELNRMQISVQEMNRTKSDDGGAFTGVPANMPVGYWQQQQQSIPPPPQQQQHLHQQVSIEQPPPAPQSQPQAVPQFQQQIHHFQQQPHQIQQHPQQVYMVHAPPQGNVYHAPMMRPVANQQQPPQQGYYQVRGSEQIYREQQVYSVGQGKYSEGMGVPVRPVAGMESNVGFHQVAYDSGNGRQVYYAAPPGSAGLVTAPFQGGSGEMRTVAAESKVVPK